MAAMTVAAVLQFCNCSRHSASKALAMTGGMCLAYLIAKSGDASLNSGLSLLWQRIWELIELYLSPWSRIMSRRSMAFREALLRGPVASKALSMASLLESYQTFLGEPSF